MTDRTQPAYRAYTVVKREGAEDFWLPIGAAFEHADQNGLNINLQALPIDGKIVLRRPKEEENTVDKEVQRSRRPGQRSAT